MTASGLFNFSGNAYFLVMQTLCQADCLVMLIMLLSRIGPKKSRAQTTAGPSSSSTRPSRCDKRLASLDLVIKARLRFYAGVEGMFYRLYFAHGICKFKQRTVTTATGDNDMLMGWSVIKSTEHTV